MNFQIECHCGQKIQVSAAQAGTEQVCVCGKKHKVPLLSQLKANHQPERREEEKSFVHPAVILMTVTSIAICFVLLTQFSHLFFPIPTLLIFAGKIWFLLLMFAEMGAIAILVFIIPGFDWLFLFKRFDVAWKPILLQAIGVALGAYLIFASL